MRSFRWLEGERNPVVEETTRTCLFLYGMPPGTAGSIAGSRANMGVWSRKAGFELSVASFTYADGRRRSYFYDPQVALQHDCSLAHWAGMA